MGALMADDESYDDNGGFRLFWLLFWLLLDRELLAIVIAAEAIERVKAK